MSVLINGFWDKYIMVIDMAKLENKSDLIAQIPIISMDQWN